MSIRLGTNIIAGRAYQPSLLDMKWSDHIIYDPSWLRADDWSWHYSSYATPAYNHLVTEWDAGNTVVETEIVAGISISYRRAADGHKIVPSDYASIVEQIYSATGVAWYYILDVTNTRFKLPRTRWGFTGLRGTVGNYVAPGLPNITGTTGIADNVVTNNGGGDGSSTPKLANSAGAFVTQNRTANTVIDTSITVVNGTWAGRLALDASRSSSIYGNSNTVQPAGTQMYLYFYCGNSAQSALETTAGINTVLFEGKVDKGHEVIAFQEPTSANNWTWYRKYADGWVEQGGRQTGNNTYAAISIDLPITMANDQYYCNASIIWSSNTWYTDSTTPASLSGTSDVIGSICDKTTTGFKIQGYSAHFWEVKGIAAA
jgi:hypothetical protein